MAQIKINVPDGDDCFECPLLEIAPDLSDIKCRYFGPLHYYDHPIKSPLCEDAIIPDEKEET